MRSVSADCDRRFPRQFILGCVFALAVPTIFTICGRSQSSPSNITAARSAMASGMAAANAGNLLEAKRQFARAVALAPTVAEGHAALGSILLSLNENKAAIKELENAHRLDPTNANVDLNLAIAKANAGLYPDAVLLFRQALAAPNAPSFLPQDSIAFATALAATNDNVNAETALRTALEAAPADGELNDAYGVVLAKRGAMEEALPRFQRAVELNPLLTQAQAHLGVALLALNRPQDALAPLQAAATAEPESFDAQLQLGRALSSLHRDPEALDALHRAAHLRTQTTSPDALYALALALQASGDVRGGLEMFEAATSSGSASSAWLINYALARVQNGDAKGALPLYARALAIGPDSPTLREDYGVAYLQQSDLDHAIEQFRQGLALDPNYPPLHYDLGLALKLKDNLAAAIPEFERAAQLDPNLPDPAYTLGVVYMQQGRFTDAATQLRRAVALQPSNGDSWALLGSVLKDSGDAAAATDALKRAIELQPDQPSLHIQLATLELEAGDKEAAAADRKIAADLSRTAVARQRATFALNSGRALLANGKIDDAVIQLLVAIHADPTLAEPHRLLADAYAREGKRVSAALERKTADSIETSSIVPSSKR